VSNRYHQTTVRLITAHHAECQPTSTYHLRSDPSDRTAHGGRRPCCYGGTSESSGNSTFHDADSHLPLSIRTCADEDEETTAGEGWRCHFCSINFECRVTYNPSENILSSAIRACRGGQTRFGRRVGTSSYYEVAENLAD
jgi:hypothetical protein